MGLTFRAGLNDPQGGCARLLPVNATLPGSGEPPSVWNDDDSTQTARSWHGSVIRLAEKTTGTLNYGWAVWVWQLLCGGTGFTLPSLHGRVPGSCEFRTRYNVQQGQAEVREANLPAR